MTTTFILEDPTASLRFHEVPGRGGIVHHELAGAVAGEAFRQVLLTGTRLLRERQATKWLSDDRRMTSLDPVDVTWGGEHWWQQAIDAGWKYWAILAPESTDGRAAFQVSGFAMKGVISDHLTVRFFTDPEAALAWLRDVDAS